MANRNKKKSYRDYLNDWDFVSAATTHYGERIEEELVRVLSNRFSEKQLIILVFNYANNPLDLFSLALDDGYKIRLNAAKVPEWLKDEVTQYGGRIVFKKRKYYIDDQGVVRSIKFANYN